jgi:hypothetical protein
VMLSASRLHSVEGSDDSRIGKDLEGSGHSLMKVHSQCLPAAAKENHEIRHTRHPVSGQESNRAHSEYKARALSLDQAPR